jgi:hypothetical protein
VSLPTPAEPTVLDATPGALWFGAWEAFNVIVWAQAATLDMVMRIDRGIAARYRALNEQRMSTVHVVLAGGGPPDPEARAALVDMNERWGHAVACGAVVIERGGLAGVALRSAVTGIIILAPKHFRVKVFDSIEPCAPWVADQHTRVTSVPLDAADLLQWLHHARRATTAPISEAT